MAIVGALWRKESKKSGEVYLSMSVDHPDFPQDKTKAMQLRAFKNKNKKSQNSPDYLIFADDQEEKLKQMEKTEEVNVEDIPF